MKYMIHACPERAWYVMEYLVPQMMKQGIPGEEIVVSVDDERRGNLGAFLWRLELIRDTEPEDGSVWHLQDDVVLSRRFAEVTQKGVFDIHGQPFKGIVCGFCNVEYDKFPHVGIVPMGRIWWSMQCMRIPNRICAEFLDWMKKEDVQEQYKQEISENKHDDYMLKEFLCTEHYEDMIYTVAPNLVNHVDYLIGGSVINQQRIKKTTKAAHWSEEDEQELKELENWLKEGGRL